MGEPFMARKIKYHVPVGYKYCPGENHQGERVLPLSEFNSGSGYCKECYREYHRRWTQDTWEVMAPTIRQLAFEHYGGKCHDCGETRQELLAIYPAGDRGVRRLLQQLKRDQWPTHDASGKEYILLCPNCRQLRKAREYGYIRAEERD